MGQNVNYLLGGQQNILGADPEVYRQQLIQREQQRIGALPPQQGLAAALGGLFGRGISNVANDRGFFEVTDPVLQKLTTIQNVYDTSMKEADPNDPMSFYTSLQKKFADAGLGQQAMMAQLEGKRFEEMNLKGEKLKTEVYTSNPRLLDEQIVKAREAGNDALANRLAEQRGQIQVKIDLDRQKEIAGIALTYAQTDAQRAQAKKLASDVESGKVHLTTLQGKFGGGTIVVTDDKGNKIREIPVTDSSMAAMLGTTPGSATSPIIPGAGTPTLAYDPQTGTFKPIGK